MAFHTKVWPTSRRNGAGEERASYQSSRLVGGEDGGSALPGSGARELAAGVLRFLDILAPEPNSYGADDAFQQFVDLLLRFTGEQRGDAIAQVVAALSAHFGRVPLPEEPGVEENDERSFEEWARSRGYQYYGPEWHTDAQSPGRIVDDPVRAPGNGDVLCLLGGSLLSDTSHPVRAELLIDQESGSDCGTPDYLALLGTTKDESGSDA